MRTLRTWVLAMCVVLLPAAALALPLDHFTIYVPDSVPAGTGFGITITAKDSTDAIIYDFTGTVTLSVSSGAGTFGPTASTAFTLSPHSQWVGGMWIKTAGDLTVTCSAGGTLTATGSADLTVVPQAYTQTLLVFPGQTYTPGLDPGVSPLTPSAIEGVPYSVTLYAVDQYYNWADYDGPMDLRNLLQGTVSLPGVGGTPTDMTQTVTDDGHALFTVAFSVTTSGSKSLSSTKPLLDEWWVSVYKTDTAYLHVISPTIITAGVPFPLTVNASASSTDPDQTITSLTPFDTFQLNAFLAGTTEPVTGTWEPTDPKGLFGGKYVGQGSYSKAEIIYLMGQQMSSNISLLGIPSHAIEVRPNLPAAVQVSVSPGRVQSSHQARVTARVLDAYGNPTRSSLYPFVVVFEQMSGNGYLSVTVCATDAYGNAFTDYTGGIINETATIRARAWHPTLGYDYANGSATVQVSVAAAEPGAIVNFPNPFNPAQGQTTAINYYLDQASDVEFRIYDPFGRLVLSKDLKTDGTDDVSRNATAAGGNTFLWDGRNGENRVVANGIYLFKLKARGGGTTQEFTRRVGVKK